ncbi:MAG: hypothetical protein D6741_21570, partial [Planctomycetota bacterium]
MFLTILRSKTIMPIGQTCDGQSPRHRFFWPCSAAVRLLAVAWAFCLVACCGVSTVSAADVPGTSPYRRSVERLLTGYRHGKVFDAAVEALADSRWASVQVLATTDGNRKVWLVTLGGPSADEKPALLVVGGVDPAQIAAPEVALRMAESLVAAAETDKKIRSLLQRYTVYIVPRLCPDATEACFAPPYFERTRNARPIDDDGDGRLDEDGPNDLDGNGVITQMRILDAKGEYVLHPDDKRILVKADPAKGESGRWRLLTEGRDDDGDEQIDEDPPGGTNPNMNFTFAYPHYASGAGPNAVSERETRALVDFAFDHPNIAAVVALSLTENLAHPWKAQSSGDRIKTKLLPDDEAAYRRIIDAYEDAVAPEDAPDSQGWDGAFLPWAYFHYGAWAAGSRVWWPPKPDDDESDAPKSKAEAKSEKTTDDAADRSEDDKTAASEDTSETPDEQQKETKADDDKAEKPAATDSRGETERNLIAWLRSQRLAGFVPWKPYRHPDFPGRRVEIGGFVPFVETTPPADALDTIVQQHVAFVKGVLGLYPRIAIESARAESLGGGLFRLTVEIVNSGELPTMSAMGKTSGRPYPVRVVLNLPERVDLVRGQRRELLSPIPARGGRTKLEWLIR